MKGQIIGSVCCSCFHELLGHFYRFDHLSHSVDYFGLDVGLELCEGVPFWAEFGLVHVFELFYISKLVW